MGYQVGDALSWPLSQDKSTERGTYAGTHESTILIFQARKTLLLLILIPDLGTRFESEDPTHVSHGLVYFTPLSALKSLRSNLLLSSGDRLGSLRIDKTASLLVVLECSCLCGADTQALAIVGAALAATVGVVDTPSCDELLGLAVSDRSRTRDVGLDEGEGCEGNYNSCQSSPLRTKDE